MVAAFPLVVCHRVMLFVPLRLMLPVADGFVCVPIDIRDNFVFVDVACERSGSYGD
jgi:hypothetical protein